VPISRTAALFIFTVREANPDGNVHSMQERGTRRSGENHLHGNNSQPGIAYCVSFPMVFVSATMMTRELEDQWTHAEDWERLGSPPSNGTLNRWGLDPDRFWRTPGAGEYKTYYLYEISLSKPGSFQSRVKWTYTMPAILLLLVLVISVCFFRKLELQHSLTIYLGTAFFCLPFLINYTQLGLGPITYTELLFYVDIGISIGLAVVSLLWFGRPYRQANPYGASRTSLSLDKSAAVGAGLGSVGMIATTHKLGLEVELWSKAPFLKIGKRKWGKRDDFVEGEPYAFRFKFRNLRSTPFPSGKAWMRIEWTSVGQVVRWIVAIPQLGPGGEGYARFDTSSVDHESEALSSGFGLFFCEGIDPGDTRLASLDGGTDYEIGVGPPANAVRSIKVTTWNAIYAKYSMYISAIALMIIALRNLSDLLLWVLRLLALISQ